MVFTHTRGLPRGKLHTSAAQLEASQPPWRNTLHCPAVRTPSVSSGGCLGTADQWAEREHQIENYPSDRAGTRRCNLENSTRSKSCSLWGWILPSARCHCHTGICGSTVPFTCTGFVAIVRIWYSFSVIKIWHWNISVLYCCLVGSTQECVDVDSGHISICVFPLSIRLNIRK